LIIQIPPFSRKWLILPEKYIQELSISHKMEDYYCDDDYINKPETQVKMLGKYHRSKHI
jgi:hypothetical protein